MWALLTFLLFLLPQGEAFRLPRHVFPSEYTIQILTDLGSDGEFTFEGIVCIKVECRKKSQNITLHARDLKIWGKDITITSAEGSPNLLSSQFFDPEYDFYVMYLSECLVEGQKYYINIPFQGNLSDGLKGYYRSSYMDQETGETRWLAVTQFEAISARKAFPCFDEPAFKARFSISIGRHNKYKSVSNMPRKKTEPMKDKPGWEWDHFHQSVRMAPYLVAFMVSDLENVISPPIPGAHDVTFRIWARQDALPQTKFAGLVGPQILNYYESFFGINFPLPKLDMVAIPDFNAGAMENWGLVTFREVLLLMEDKAASCDNRESIANTIAHELAHQWFGNLVTMKWWNDLWLNEGFATYVAYHGVHALYPQWNTLDMNIVQLLERVLPQDAIQSSHPVSSKIESFSAIDEIFDSISYQKGAFMLRMMSLFLGPEVFRKGISNYLCKFKYKNAEEDDLWKSLTKEAHRQSVLPKRMTVKKIMDTWTLQTGYPIVTITRCYKSGTAKVKQSCYRTYKAKKSNESSCWILPITYTSQRESNFESAYPKHWSSCGEKITKLRNLPLKNEWIIFNIKIISLCRVNYDKRNWNLIINTLHSNNFSCIGLLNRVQLVEDAFGLAWTGHIHYSTTIRLVTYLIKEKEYLPWKTAVNHLDKFKGILCRTQEYENFKKYLRKLFLGSTKPELIISDIPITEDIQRVRMHILKVKWACFLQMAKCTEQAIQLFCNWMNEEDPDANNPIPIELRSIVYCTAIASGGRREWDFAWERYLNSNFGSEKSLLLTALGCSKKQSLLIRYLGMILRDDTGIRKQDIYQVFAAVVQNENGYHLALNFIMEKASEIYYFTKTQNCMARFLLLLAKQMFTKEDLRKLEELTEKNVQYFGSSSLIPKQAQEIAFSNAYWFNQYYPHFLDALCTFYTRIN